jgi:hypothetical protein
MKRRTFTVALLPLWAARAHAEPPPAEQLRIERLLQAVALRTELRFVRNGSDYPAQDAVEFLRRKLSSSYGSNVKTVHDFIEQCATRSSTSGELYQVRMADGRVMPSADFLRQELKRVEARH